MKKFTVTLQVTLEDADAEQTQTAMLCTEKAIRNRLFGDGYLPDDILVDTYSINSIEDK